MQVSLVQQKWLNRNIILFQNFTERDEKMLNYNFI